MVNLLSKEQELFLRTRARNRLVASALGLGAIACVLAVIVLVTFSFIIRARILNYEAEKERIAQTLAQVQISPEDVEVREYVYLLTQAGEVLKRPEYSSDIEAVVAAVSPGVRLYSIGFEGEHQLSLHGEVVNRAALVTFASALRRQERIEHVDVPIANFVEGSDAPFSVTLTLYEDR